jgi:hypothetical protein
VVEVLNPAVPYCEPGGANSSWVVAASGVSFEVAEHDQWAVLAATVQEGVRVFPDRGGLGGYNGYAANLTPLPLVRRAEPPNAGRSATSISQQHCGEGLAGKWG